jgi:predicted small metal-binding protein
MVTFKCVDIGLDCKFEIQGKDVDEILAPIAVHACIQHGIDYFDDELVEKITSVTH